MRLVLAGLLCVFKARDVSTMFEGKRCLERARGMHGHLAGAAGHEEEDR